MGLFDDSNFATRASNGAIVANPMTLEELCAAIRELQKIDEWDDGTFLHRYSPLYGIPIYANDYIPRRATREAVDDSDPFVDYEGDTRLARSNGFTKQEEYTPLYAMNLGLLPMVHSPNYLLASV